MLPFESRSFWFKLSGAVAIAVVGVIGFLVLRSFQPNDASWHPKCVFHLWTGLHCPGCGTTRALHALPLGQWWTAVRCNPLLVVGLPVITFLLWQQRRRERSGGPVSPRLSWTIGVVVIAYFVLRNVPSPDRSWLAPPAEQVSEASVDE